MSNSELYLGDCMEYMQNMPANSIDTVITDPPAGISFMGLPWDHKSRYDPCTENGNNVLVANTDWLQPWETGFLAFIVDYATLALRVTKPGAINLTWALPRISDLTKFGLRLAGWEIRDTVYHLFSQGFPKSLDISQSFDRETVAEQKNMGDEHDAYDMVKLWNGWGTGLKPAVEEWIVAMKPREGTYVQNAKKWGVAGYWIDGAKVPTYAKSFHDKGRDPSGSSYSLSLNWSRTVRKSRDYDGTKDRLLPTCTEDRLLPTCTEGRWPANLIHDGSPKVLVAFPYTVSKRSTKPSDCDVSGYTAFNNIRGNRPPRGYDDQGSAARYFYCTKAFSTERDQDLPDGMVNSHPTLKPLKLMEYLCTLTRTPTGGTVLDPFMGSGTTGVACVRTNRDFVGCEIDPDCYSIAEQRINYAQAQPRQLELLG